MTTTTKDPLQHLFNAGYTPETAQAAVARLDDIAAAIDRLRLASAEEFERAYAVKRALGSLGCYLFNNHLEPWERVFALEGTLGALMRRWARRYFGRFTPETMTLVRYLLGNHRYTSENLPKIVTHLIGARAIARLLDGRVCVRGPHLAQGDNVFGIRQDGSQFRRYVRVCVPQVYVVPRELARRARGANPRRDPARVREHQPRRSIEVRGPRHAELRGSAADRHGVLPVARARMTPAASARRCSLPCRSHRLDVGQCRIVHREGVI